MRHTVETRTRLSRMRSGERNPMAGRTHTPESRAKMANETRPRGASQRFVLQPQSVSIPEGVALGYLAGLIDGEGSMRFHRDRPFVAVYGERAVVDWLVANVGGSYGKPDTRGRVPCYCWTVQAARDVAAVCRAVVDLLNVKMADCMLVLEHLEGKYEGAV